MIESHIKVYDDITPVGLCRDIISTFESDQQGHLPGLVSGGKHPSERDSTCLNLTERSTIMPESWGVIDASLSMVISNTWRRYYQELNMDGLIAVDIADEGYEVHRYSPDKGHYNTHIDCGSLQTSARFLSMIMYLNDVEKGETCFPLWNTEVTPKEGRIVVFPSAFTHMHSAVPPVDGYKYIIPVFLSYGGDRVSANR